MSENEKRVPKRRFKEFENAEAWKQCKLGDESIEIVAGGDINKNKIVDSGKYPVLANALTNDGIVGYYEDDFRIKAPAVTVTGRGDVGHAKARKVDFTPVVRLLSVKTKHDVDFLENAINNHEVLVESTGVPQLTVPQLSKYEIYFPKIDNEEKVIGVFFKKLDDVITLHQRKVEKMKALKEAYLTDMFPAEGQCTPKLRFDGFSDNWEQRRLGDIAAFINGRAYKQDELLNSGKYKVLRVGNFYTNGAWYYSDMELSEKYYADYGDLLYTWSATFGPHIWFGDRVIYHYHIWKIDLSDKLNKQFAVHLLNKDKEQITSDKNGSTMVHITKEGMEKKEVIVPSVAEQIKISGVLDNIDNLITIHQRKLEKLQNIKKAYLNEMFI